MTAAPCPSTSAPTADCRCVCGSLVARVVDGRVELKCRRCKRIVRVPLSAEGFDEAPRQGVARGAR